MTKVCPETEERTLQEPVLTVSTDVSFASNHFPIYKLGPDNQIVEEPKENEKGPSVKDTVEKESQLLSDQHKRLSVRDLASKFDKNLAAAVSLADEAKLREVASLEGHVMLKKLRDALEYMRGRTDGQNKEDVEKAISMVEALAAKLTQNEGELIQEKFEVKKLGNFLKQASEDAKKLINHEKSFACAEIETARAVVLRLGEAFEEQERSTEASRAEGPDVEKMVEEVQEARQIKRMHHPTKVMGMQHELHGLRNRIQEKYMNSVKLHQEIATIKRAEESKSCAFVLEGTQSLGSCLKIRVNAPDSAIDLSNCSIQWYRAACETSRREAISGANQAVYAPEPFDVGRILQADILSKGQKVTVTTDGPIDPDSGLQSRVESLMRKSNSEFSVVISQMNGQDYASRSHVFTVGKTRIKLSRGWITKAREIYSTSMQLCGFRGNVKAPTKSLLWQPRKSLTFILTFESEQERNAAIALARKYAFDCNIKKNGGFGLPEARRSDGDGARESRISGGSGQKLPDPASDLRHSVRKPSAAFISPAPDYSGIVDDRPSRHEVSASGDRVCSFARPRFITLSQSSPSQSSPVRYRRKGSKTSMYTRSVWDEKEKERERERKVRDEKYEELAAQVRCHQNQRESREIRGKRKRQASNSCEFRGERGEERESETSLFSPSPSLSSPSILPSLILSPLSLSYLSLSLLFLVPEGCDMIAAAALPVAFGTSHVALVHRARLTSGQVLMVLGAAGGVGLAAVQIGKICGAIVIAVARGSEKIQLLKSMGVDHVVDLGSENVIASVKEFVKARKLKGVDVLYDPVGGKLTKESMKVLNWGAQILVIGFASGEVPLIPANIALVKNWTVHGLYWGSYKIHQPSVLDDSIRELLSWLARGLITIHISHTYSLSQANLAFGDIKDRKAIGKVMIALDHKATLSSKL